MNERKEKYKILVMTILLAGACVLTYYFHVVLETGTIFTHYFYIPIILASLWWKRKGLVVAVFLAGLIFFSNIFVRIAPMTAHDYFRAVMFIVIAFVVVTLSEQIAKSQEELESKVDDRAKELREEKRFTENIIATVPDSLLVLDKNLRIKSVNRSFYEKFQTEPDEVIGSSIAEVLGDKDGKLSAALTKQFGTGAGAGAGAGDIRENFKLHYQSEKLGERIFNVTARGMLVEEEELVVLEDITERKKAEEALRKSEERYRSIFESIQDVYAEVALDGTILEITPSIQSFSGYATEEVLGRSLAEFYVYPEQRAALLERLRLEGSVSDYEVILRHKTGRAVMSSFTVKVVTDASGTPVKTVGTMRDITERKRAEEEVKKSRKFLDTIIENIPDPLYIKDRQFRFVEVNKAFCRTRKVTKGEILGETRYRETDDEIFKTGKELEIPEQHYTDAEGNQHWTHLKKVPLTDESGETTHVLTISRDITKRKAMEDALHATYNELKTLDKLKTDFLNVTYHDLRSPLAPIIGYASLLEQSKLSEKQKNYVRVIEKSSRQLEEMIARMLEATRIETGKVELTLEPVSIAEIVNNVLERIKPQVDAKKQTISTVVPEGIEVEGDKQKIAAIFDNLILNAIKYTDEKGRIDIMVEDRNEKKDIRVCVEDTGAGISEENLPRIFERFYMVDTSLTRKGGLGLGLTIVKGYVKLHGGEAWVTSELGKGSKFCFTLPKKQK